MEELIRGRKFIAVIGGSTCPGEILELAEQVGEEIAKFNGILVCGGLGGVMEASCRGAKSFGGVTIGILPGDDPADANPFVDIPIATGMGISRNQIIIKSSNAAVAIDGKYGTLSEICFCLQLNVPVIGLRTWDIEGVIPSDTAKEAVRKAFELA
ncbi:MAG: TIGR00725 family protein [Fidelibacterota bacterium]